MKNLQKEFSKIYDQYIERIYRFIFLKVNSKEIAEDLTSETFLRTWQIFQEDHQKIENMTAFLYQVARNLVNDYYREKRKTQIVSTEVVPNIVDPAEGILDKIAKNSDLELIKKALKEMNEDYQNAIIWYYIEGLSVKEIAKTLGRTEEATRVLISRALKSLKNKIQEV